MWCAHFRACGSSLAVAHRQPRAMRRHVARGKLSAQETTSARASNSIAIIGQLDREGEASAEPNYAVRREPRPPIRINLRVFAAGAATGVGATGRAQIDRANLV